MNFSTILVIAALVLFVLGAIPRFPTGQLMSAGLACVTLARLLALVLIAALCSCQTIVNHKKLAIDGTLTNTFVYNSIGGDAESLTHTDIGLAATGLNTSRSFGFAATAATTLGVSNILDKGLTAREAIREKTAQVGLKETTKRVGIQSAERSLGVTEAATTERLRIVTPPQ